MSRSRKKVFSVDCLCSIRRCSAHPDEWNLFEVTRRGEVMVPSSSSKANTQPHNRSLQSANTYETSRCQML